MFPCDSPFTDKLNTNYVPSDSDIPAIHALLLEPEDELARLHTQIAELETALATLRAKHASLKASIDAHRALTSPIRRIPHDVLLEIFAACLPSTHNALIDPAEAPLLLGRICRLWRSAAYSTPRLWSSIHIPALHSDEAPPAAVHALDRVVEAWLERSATCPLSVSFTEYAGPSDTGSARASPIHAVLKFSSRLRHLELSASVHALHLALNLAQNDLPLLQTIGIKHSGNKPFREFPHTALCIPSLRDVSLYISGDPLSLPLQWSQLTGLSLICFPAWTDHGTEGGVDANTALEVLRRCPNLQRCQIQISKPDAASDNAPLVTMPHLHTLILGSPFALPDAILHLALPSLASLRIEAMSARRGRRRRLHNRGATALFDEADWALDTDYSSDPRPSRLGCSLKAFIDPSRFPRASLVAVLQRFPHITHLRLLSMAGPEPILDDAFLALLSGRAASSSSSEEEDLEDPLCPRLTHLAVNAPCAGFSDAAVRDFVCAREEMGSPLEQLRIEFDRAVEVDIVGPLISEGRLELELQYTTPQWRFDPREGLFKGPEAY